MENFSGDLEIEEAKHDAIMSRIAFKIQLACAKLRIKCDVPTIEAWIYFEYVRDRTIEMNCRAALDAAYGKKIACTIMDEISLNA